MKYGFVILHYLALDMTIECIDQLLSSFNEYDIVLAVVDNGSPNDSGDVLRKRYAENNRVNVLLNQKNVGFARGNNIGYSYLNEHYNPDFIIVMNNDVLITQKTFLDEVLRLFRRHKFGVLGPDIYCPKKNEHQNPAHIEGFTVDEVVKMKKHFEEMSNHFFYKYYRHAVVQKIRMRFKSNTVSKNVIDYKISYINPVLHGACYVFSRSFIDIRDYAFNPKTFLYLEEDILHYECKENNILMLYSPSLAVMHMEDVSTCASMKKEVSRQRMKNIEILKSVNVLLDLMYKKEDRL